MNKIELTGYAPTDLIERLQSASWAPCLLSGSWENFSAIIFDENVVLTRPCDTLSNIRYRVTVENLNRSLSTDGPRFFRVEGYSFEGLLDLIRPINRKIYNVSFDGERLWNRTQKDLRTDEDAYKATIEIVA